MLDYDSNIIFDTIKNTRVKMSDTNVKKTNWHHAGGSSWVF